MLQYICRTQYKVNGKGGLLPHMWIISLVCGKIQASPERVKNRWPKKISRYPVVTLVLYFGTDTKWTAPKSLCKCFVVPEELKPFVSDYKINVFDIAWLSDKTIEMFKSDFKFVAQYFQTKRTTSNNEKQLYFNTNCHELSINFGAH